MAGGRIGWRGRRDVRWPSMKVRDRTVRFATDTGNARPLTHSGAAATFLWRGRKTTHARRSPMMRRTLPDSATIRAALAALVCLMFATPAFAGSENGTTAKDPANPELEGQPLLSLSNDAMNRLLMNIPPPRISPHYAGGCDGISGGPNCADNCYSTSCRDDNDCTRKNCTKCSIVIFRPGVPPPPFSKCS